MTDIDLTDERSIAGVVRDAVLSTELIGHSPVPVTEFARETAAACRR